VEITDGALLIWIPLSAFFFLVMRPVRALVLAYLIGYLILPVDTDAINISGFWNIDKLLATNAGVLLGTLLFCPGRFRGFRPTVADAILVLFAVGACVTSVTNGLGTKDGVSSMAQKLFEFAIPFWLGRALLKTPRDLLEAVRLIFGGAALYAILAVWEWRMSPQVYQALYGHFPHSWTQHVRWGFYRPVVCFEHALALGMFMAWTALLGLVLLRARLIRPVFGLPPMLLAFLPVLGLVTSMSFGPWILFLIGCGLLLGWRRLHWRWLMLAPAVFGVVWMGGRYTSSIDGEWMTAATEAVSPGRAETLQYRIRAEELLLARAKEQPVFGWGTWGRNRIIDEEGRDVVATDSRWVLYVGSYGLFGLTTFFLWWCWPFVMCRRVGRVLETHPLLMGVLIVIGMQVVNLLFNAFISPMEVMLSGAAVTALAQLRRARVPVARPAAVGVALPQQPAYPGCVS
jgi:hypothetical protein